MQILLTLLVLLVCEGFTVYNLFMALAVFAAAKQNPFLAIITEDERPAVYARLFFRAAVSGLLTAIFLCLIWG